MGEYRDTAQDRVTIQEAARRLGVKEDAIRKRIQRGTLRHEKAEKGRVFVWVDAAQDTTQDATEDTYQAAYLDARNEVVEELRDRIQSLERRLDEERESRRRADTIIAQLTQANATLATRVPELEPPQEPPGAPQTATEQPGRVEPQASVEGPPTGVQRPERSWRQTIRGLRRRFVG